MKVFLADDHPLLRMALRIGLNRESDIEVTGEANDGFSAVEKIQAYPPDVALIDVDMPGLSGINAIRILRKAVPDLKIIVLSTYDDRQYVREAMKAGADGYLLKRVDVEELVRVLRSFVEGKSVVSPYLLNLTLVDGSDETHGDFFAMRNPLTGREKEILRYVAEGKSNKDISNTLHVSIETVKSHLKNIYEKLGVKNRVEAAAKAAALKSLD